MRCVLSPLAIALACPLAIASLRGEDAAASVTVGWRGDGTGVYASARPPLEWSSEEKKGIIWKAKVGSGYSSPVAAGGRVLVTSEPDRLICVESTDGKVAWEKRDGLADQAGAGPKRELPAKEAGYATPTPLTDGKSVFVTFGTGIVACHDLGGERRWIRHIDAPPASPYGRGSSPVLADGKLLISIGCLTALDPATGKTLWESKGAVEAFGTPALTRIGGATVAITGNGDCVRVSDGAIVEKGLGNSIYTSPVCGAGSVFFVGPQTVAVKLPEKLDGRQEFKRMWLTEMEGEFFSSPVLLGGVLYAASNQGTLHALDPVTGETIYEAHVDIPSQMSPPGVEPGHIYPSLSVAGGVLFLGNDKGDMLVAALGKEFRKIGRNDLEEGAAGSPAFEGAFVYLRGGEFLYCIGAR